MVKDETILTYPKHTLQMHNRSHTVLFFSNALNTTMNSLKTVKKSNRSACQAVCVLSAMLSLNKVFTMVCCAAWGCSNRLEKGMCMYGLPKDRDRRKV